MCSRNVHSNCEELLNESKHEELLNQLLSVTSSLTDAAVTQGSSSSSSDSGSGNCSERRQWPRGLCSSPSSLACFIAVAGARAVLASASETLRLLLIASARAVASLADASRTPLSPPSLHSSSAQLSSVQSDLSTWRANLTHCIRPISDDAAVYAVTSFVRCRHIAHITRLSFKFLM